MEIDDGGGGLARGSGCGGAPRRSSSLARLRAAAGREGGVECSGGGGWREGRAEGSGGGWRGRVGVARVEAWSFVQVGAPGRGLRERVSRRSRSDRISSVRP